MNDVKIKICGLRRQEDIETVNRFCPDFCGFIINFPKSHRSLTPAEVSLLTEKLDRERIKAVGVFVDEKPEIVAGILNSGITDMAQLHGNESEEYIAELRKLTDRPIIKAFTVKEEKDLLRAAGSSADYILLDSGQGSGKAFDHSLLETGNPVKDKKWFLAGGLDEENISEKINRFVPFAVDLSSAVETDGFKDPEKIRRIIGKVRRDNP